MTRTAYEAALTKNIAEIVKKQVDAGIDIVTDGECSKPSFQAYVAERLDGFEPRMPAGGLPVPTGPMGVGGRDAQLFPDFYRNVLENNPFKHTIRMRAARLRRTDPLCRAGETPARYPQSEKRDGRPRAPMKASCRRWRRRLSLEERILQERRRIPRSLWRGDARGMEGDPRCRVCCCRSISRASLPPGTWQAIPWISAGYRKWTEKPHRAS